MAAIDLPIYEVHDEKLCDVVGEYVCRLTFLSNDQAALLEFAALSPDAQALVERLHQRLTELMKNTDEAPSS